MSKAIDGVPREWLENYAVLLTEHFALDAAKKVRTFLAAPAVERQEPLLLGHLYRVAEDQIEIEIVGDPHIKDGMEVFTSPPAPVAVVRYKTYITQPAESLAGMAARQLKDEKRWIEIRDANSREFPDMCASDYYPVGSAIMIPVTACLDKVKEMNKKPAPELFDVAGDADDFI